MTESAVLPTIDPKRLHGALPGVAPSPRALQRAQTTGLSTLAVLDVPLGLIHFFPDNHNEQDERTFVGECESLLRFGMVDPCLVRPFDEADLAAGIGQPGAYEMIDGEHRTRSVATWMEQGLPQGAHPDLIYLCEHQVIPCLVQPMSRAWAARLRVVLSETRGRANPVKLGKVLSSLVEEVGLEELRVGTPWTVEHVREIVEVGRFDWDAFEREQKERQAGAAAGSGLVKVVLEVPASQVEGLQTEIRPLIERFGLRVKTSKAAKKK